MLAEDTDGLAPAMKRTRILSNAAEVLKRIGRQCTNKESEEQSRDKALEKKHRHANLMNGRAKQCQVYPREFCRAVCVGVAAQKQLYKMGLRNEPFMTVAEMRRIVPGEFDTGDPGRDLHDMEPEGEYVLTDGTMAYDDQSGIQLRPELVMQARRDEVQYFRDMSA